MIKKTIAFLVALTLFTVCFSAFSVAEENDTYGAEFIDELLTGAVEGDSIMVDVNLLPDYDYMYDTSSIFEHDAVSAEIKTVIANKNKNIKGTYRKYDSGETPVIVVLEGTGNESQYSVFLKAEDLSKYNMYVFNSTSKDGKSYSISNAKNAEDLYSGYCQAITEEVKKAYPNATKIGVVSYSAGGYGSNGVVKSAAQDGMTISWVAGYDNIPKEEKKFTTFDDFIKKNSIPSMLCISSDRFRPITKNTKTEAESNPNDYSIINTYDGNHGNFVKNNSTNTSTGTSLFSDLAKFAEENFFGIKQKNSVSNNKSSSKGTSTSSSGSSVSTEYALLAKTQQGLVLKLNENKASNTKKTAAKVVSGVASAIASSVVASTSSGTSKSTSNKSSSNIKDSVSTSTSVSSSSSSNTSFWSKATNSVASSLNKVNSALKALAA